MQCELQLLFKIDILRLELLHNFPQPIILLLQFKHLCFILRQNVFIIILEASIFLLQILNVEFKLMRMFRMFP